MILDCPACGAALVFDPESGKMKCESCSNLYETFELQEDYIRRGEAEARHEEARRKNLMQDIANKDSLDDSINSYAASREPSFNPESSFDNPIYDHSSDNNKELDLGNSTEDDTMECSIYTCSSCGAEIMVNDLEVSTFCAYCGQPTLIFSRIENAKKPKYIIPFSVTKERAIALVKEKFDKGFFVPDEIRNLNPERVRGIYIPYWLFDIHYEDKAFLKGTVGSGKNATTYRYYRAATSDFDKIGLDGSKQLNDTVARKLNPYYPGYIKDFSMEYLSGFYADKYDDDLDKLKAQAILRAKNTFEGELKRSVAASNVQIIKNSPTFSITDMSYALYPAWFITFNDNGTPYTLLINGQTEKLVGSVPYDKERAKIYFFILSFFLMVLIWCIIFPFLLAIKMFDPITLATLMVVGIAPFKQGISNLKRLKESRHLTALSITNEYVKNRQGG